MENPLMVWSWFKKSRAEEEGFSCEFDCSNCGTRHTYSDPQFSELVRQSCRATDAKMRELAEKFRIGTDVGTWFYDEDVGFLEFHLDDGRICETPLSYIGSWFEPRQEFLWAWGNDHLPEEKTGPAKATFAFGEEHGYTPLRTNLLWVSLSDAWHLAKLAVEISKVRGVYGAPVSDKLTLFFAITNPKWRTAQ